MTSGQSIGKSYPTLMPDLTDIADVQQAFSLYHFGVPDFDPVTQNPAADSIEGHLGAVNERVTELEGRPVAGGQVTSTEPTEVGDPPQGIPEGYIWVDPSETSPVLPDFPTVIYSPTEPTGLTVLDTGTIWVDEDGSAAVLNVNDYQVKTKFLPDAPSNPVEGQMWVDSDNNSLYYYNGTSWISVGGGASGGFTDTFLLMGA